MLGAARAQPRVRHIRQGEQHEDLAHIVAAAALAGGTAAPASAQVEANAHAQGVIGDIIDGLIGNRYAVSDRQAIRRCGWAAVDKAERQFRTQFRGRRGFLSRLSRLCPRRRDHRCLARSVQPRAGPRPARHARNGYGGRYGADLAFRCDADRNGRVSDVRVERNPGYRPR